MFLDKSALVNNQYYSKKIIRIYGWMVFLSFGGHFIDLLITSYMFHAPSFSYVLTNLLLPSLMQLFILWIIYMLMKYKHIHNANLLIFAGTAIAFITVLRNSEVPSLQVIFLLMMAVSLLYFDDRKLRNSLLINAVALSFLYLFPSVRHAAHGYEYFTFLFILFVGYMVFQIIVNRGKEVVNVLQQAAEKEQHLIVKSTVMERLTKIDGLTNLYNHRTFHEYLEFLYEQSISQGMPLHLGMIDIDDFKKINDTYGHDAGDAVIKKVAQILSENVTEDEIVSRYGGEEFTILFTNKTLKEAYNISERIRLGIANQSYEELDEKVTVSIGLQPLESNMSKAHFFKKTDMLLYAAKRTGKNQIITETDFSEKETWEEENVAANSDSQ